MAGLEAEDLQQIVREQSRIVQTDADQAVDTLPRLLPHDIDKSDALALIEAALEAIERRLEPQEQVVLDRVVAVLAKRESSAGQVGSVDSPAGLAPEFS
jgi:hypothetical protein